MLKRLNYLLQMLYRIHKLNMCTAAVFLFSFRPISHSRMLASTGSWNVVCWLGYVLSEETWFDLRQLQDLSLKQNRQTGSWVHRASRAMAIGNCFPGGEAAKIW